MSISDEQSKKYIEGGGVQCPFCGSDNIAGDSLDFHGGWITQEITCQSCFKDWSDVYQLVSVEG